MIDTLSTDLSRRAAATAALAIGLLTATAAHANTINQESVNVGNAPTAGVNWAPQDVGWYWTSSTSFSLTGIATEFASTDGRQITVEILNDRGAVAGGGTVLGSATYNPAGGTLGGVTFATALSVAAGTQYFIGFLGVEGLGINVTGLLPTDATFLTGTTLPPDGFGDSGDGDFASEFTGGGAATSGTCGGLDCPILAFQADDDSNPTGNPGTPAVPEPATLMLFGVGLAGIGVMRRRSTLSAVALS